MFRTLFLLLSVLSSINAFADSTSSLLCYANNDYFKVTTYHLEEEGSSAAEIRESTGNLPFSNGPLTLILSTNNERQYQTEDNGLLTIIEYTFTKRPPCGRVGCGQVQKTISAEFMDSNGDKRFYNCH